MDNRWHRAAGGWFGQDQKPGSVTLFWNWDLLDWTFGVRFEVDPGWHDFHVHFGPISFDFCRWRDWQWSRDEIALNASERAGGGI